MEEGIAKASSAYMIYSRAHSSLVREELSLEGKDASVGSVTTLVASRVGFAWL